MKLFITYSLGGMVISKWISGSVGVDWIQLAKGLLEGSCEHDNLISGSVKCEERLDELSDYEIFNKYTAQWVCLTLMIYIHVFLLILQLQ
jgi:hypothetical protein